MQCIGCGVLDLLNDEAVTAAEKAMVNANNDAPEGEKWSTHFSGTVRSSECSSSLSAESCGRRSVDGAVVTSPSMRMPIGKSDCDPRHGKASGLDTEETILAVRKQDGFIVELS